jgi:uncharacterized membrane protein YhiD involved in acid resistance
MTDVALHRVLGIALAYALSMLVATVYARIHRGTAVQHTFVQTLSVAGVVAAVVVLAIGDNVARGIGLIGALTVIRFRSTLQDPRDLIFAFAALATGVAAGARAYEVAVLGTAVFLGGIALASRVFAGRGSFEAILTLRARSDGEALDALSRVLNEQTRTHDLVRVRQLGNDEQEHSYQVTLERPRQRAELLRQVEAAGASQAMLVAYAPAVEA